MDTPQHCLDQSAECRRLMKFAHSEAEVYSLALLARTWAALAGQIDRYIKIIREQRGVVSPEGAGEQGLTADQSEKTR